MKNGVKTIVYIPFLIKNGIEIVEFKQYVKK